MKFYADAIKAGNTKALTALLLNNKEATRLLSAYHEQETLLHLAILHNQFEIAHLLLHAGANPNALTLKGDTCLHLLSGPKAPHPPAPWVRLLQQYDVDFRRRNSKGFLPYEWALRQHKDHVAGAIFNVYHEKRSEINTPVYTMSASPKVLNQQITPKKSPAHFLAGLYTQIKRSWSINTKPADDLKKNLLFFALFVAVGIAVVSSLTPFAWVLMACTTVSVSALAIGMQLGCNLYDNHSMIKKRAATAKPRPSFFPDNSRNASQTTDDEQAPLLAGSALNRYAQL